MFSMCGMILIGFLALIYDQECMIQNRTDRIRSRWVHILPGYDMHEPEN